MTSGNGTKTVSKVTTGERTTCQTSVITAGSFRNWRLFKDVAPEDRKVLLGFELDQLETEHYFLDIEMRELRRKMFDIHEKLEHVKLELEELELAAQSHK